MTEHLPAACRWTSRLAVFSLVVFAAAALLHRLGLPTPAAFNMVIMAYAGASLAFVLAVAGTASIWRHGGGGTSRVVVGFIISMLMFGVAGIAGTLASQFPVLNDVTTDTQSPPVFVELAKLRGAASNPSDYPKPFAAVQAKYYPDIKPLVIERSVEEAQEIAMETLRRQRFQIVHEDPSGVIEAFDRTMILGFYDDISVRITGNEERARIDVRSASRFGVSDFGHNATRVRTLLKEMVARLEETVPTAEGERVSSTSKIQKPGSKAEKERSRKKEIPRKPQVRDRQGALREPAPKGSRQAEGGSQAPDKRPAQSRE